MKKEIGDMPVGNPKPQTVATAKYEKKRDGCQNLIS